VRIRSNHGTTPSPSADQTRNLIKRATKRHNEGIHINNLSTHQTSRRPSIDQTLDKLAVVGSHALQGGFLDFLKDEVTSIYLPELLGLAIVKQISVVAPDSHIIPSLAHKILTKELRKSIVVVVHP
jgi:hypothetical protein